MSHVRLRCLVVLTLLALGLAGGLSAQVQTRGNNIWRVYKNDTTTGTTQYRLAKIVPSTGEGKAIRAANTDTTIPLCVVGKNGATTPGGTTTTGDVTCVWVGEMPCEMDSPNASGVANWPVVVGTGGACHAQAALPSNAYVVGYMISDSTASGQRAQVMMGNVPISPAPTGGPGTVTSAGLTMPSEFSVAGSPITGNSAFNVTKANETANFVWAGPASGAAAAPTFRALVSADLPAGTVGGNAAGDVTGPYTALVVGKASGSFALTGVQAQTMAANLNDFALGTAVSLLNITASNPGLLLTGMAGCDAGRDGREVRIRNVGATNAFTLSNQSASSAPGNRFAFGADVTVPPGGSWSLSCDLGNTRWRATQSTIIDPYKVRTCVMPFGSVSPDAAPLGASDNLPKACPNDAGLDGTILSVALYCDGGSSSFTPITDGGTATSILTGACTCGTPDTWKACNVQAALPVIHSFTSTTTTLTCTTTPCGASGQVTSVDGVTKFALLKIKWVLP